jgi:MerR family mercuric resistance operon transcriptional regulator
MGKHLTVGQLAKAAAVPSTTVRYYERAGLLKSEVRSAGNYRLYGDESLRRLKFIRAAQAIGFRLDNVQELLGRVDEQPPPCRDVQSLIEVRLAEIEKRLKDLHHVQRVLKSSLQKCKKTERAGCCHVIETLRQTS